MGRDYFLGLLLFFRLGEIGSNGCPVPFRSFGVPQIFSSLASNFFGRGHKEISPTQIVKQYMQNVFFIIFVPSAECRRGLVARVFFL
jgi:hypothetical protein